MVKNWKVSWNKKLYDYERRIELFKQDQEDTILQSKGFARMVNLPEVGDFVYVSCNKKKIMKCEIISNFIVGLQEKLDECNKGNPRSHTDNNEYLKMKILYVYDKPEILIGCQRTWSKYNENE